jgi:predicted ATP-grasp superfamily ATP-dependent carboligase
MTTILLQKRPGNMKAENPSSSGTLLARSLGIHAIGVTSTRYTSIVSRRKPLVIINWGLSDSTAGILTTDTVMNSPESVHVCSNKLRSFNALHTNNVPCLDFTTNRSQAESWLVEGAKVVCRQLLSGSSGRGITVAANLESMVDAPLYTRYIRNRHEYRVHIVNGVSYIQKKIRLNAETLRERGIFERDKHIRNVDNGYVYTSNHDLSTENSLLIIDLAKRAVSAMGLDFGGVDILYDRDSFIFKVIEVNSAPGLSPDTTLPVYVEGVSLWLSSI